MTKPFILVLDGGSVASAFRSVGAEVELANRADDIAEAMPYVDALVLTGGGDVDPHRYGQPRSKKCWGINPSRDQREFDAVNWARQLGIPQFGICRGMQLLNVAYGGTLHQDIPSGPGFKGHSGTTRPVEFDGASRVGMAIGLKVPESTHLHHQAVDELGTGLRIVGQGADKCPEAIESVGDMPYVLGVQFHPEMDLHRKEARAIFRHFINVVAGAPVALPDEVVASTAKGAVSSKGLPTLQELFELAEAEEDIQGVPA
jgi:gamma-glutamyl-gamma-aminobutyrate hydrolase PuuD